MKELGLPFLLIAAVLTAFKVILDAVDRLNAISQVGQAPRAWHNE